MDKVGLVATVLLVRHGRSTANDGGILAGRTPGVALDAAGREQATDLAARLASLPIRALVSSPLLRCRQTARLLADQPGGRLPMRTERRLAECDYGDWTGRPLRTLARQPLWRAVQAHPSGVVFPGGESMRDMAARAVSAVRDWDARLEDEHGADAMWVAVTHGDLIKAVLADALAMHLDSFQRIVADPGSVSVVSYRPLRPFVVRLNEHGDLSGLRPARRRRRARRAASDAVVGGGAGGAVP